MYDLIIIGGGAAGLTAAIYAARADLNFIILEQDGFGGGQITSAHMVENYPGVPNTSGADLGEIIKNQAVALGAEIRFGIVTSVTSGDAFTVSLQTGETMKAKAVIAATGATPRKMGIRGEQEFLGKGVSYCAVCDGAFFKNKTVAVIGGGDTAVEDAVYLAEICEEVVVVHRRNEFRAPKTRVDKLKKLSNVEFRLNATLAEIVGEHRVTGMRLNTPDGEKEIPVNGVFMAIGTVPATEYLQHLPLRFENGYVVANEDCITPVAGLFAAGDIRKKPLRQVTTAVADGAEAANSAIEYLRNL